MFCQKTCSSTLCKTKHAPLHNFCPSGLEITSSILSKFQKFAYRHSTISVTFCRKASIPWLTATILRPTHKQYVDNYKLIASVVYLYTFTLTIVNWSLYSKTRIDSCINNRKLVSSKIRRVTNVHAIESWITINSTHTHTSESRDAKQYSNTGRVRL